MMTRKHFSMIAQTVRNARLTYPAGGYDTPAEAEKYREIFDGIAADFARKLAAENPRFDRSKFLAACGVPQ